MGPVTGNSMRENTTGMYMWTTGGKVHSPVTYLSEQYLDVTVAPAPTAAAVPLSAAVAEKDNRERDKCINPAICWTSPSLAPGAGDIGACSSECMCWIRRIYHTGGEARYTGSIGSSIYPT